MPNFTQTLGTITVRHLTFILLVGIVCSCGSEIESETVSEEFTVDSDTLKNGEFTWYYEGTELPSNISTFVNDTLNGPGKEFYRNGQIKSTFEYCNGELCGTMLLYDSLGNLTEKRTYTPVHDIEDYFLNTWIEYDLDGNILLEKSHFYTLNEPEMPIKQGSTVNLEFKIESPYYGEKFELVEGEFDSKYKPISELKHTETTSPKINIPLNTEQPGKQLIRFIVNDINVVNDSIIELKPIPVEYSYLVE